MPDDDFGLPTWQKSTSEINIDLLVMHHGCWEKLGRTDYACF